jgi:hypothetical protein
MSYLPKDELEPPRDSAGGSGGASGSTGKDGKGEKKGPSTNRIIMWVVVGGIGAYMVASGLIGILGN